MTPDELFSDLGHGLRLLRTKGLSTPFLFDFHGIYQPDAPPDPVVETLEQAVYRKTAEYVEGGLIEAGQRIRSGTHFRFAGALIVELFGASPCARCDGRGVDRAGLQCMKCYGTGATSYSPKWRSDMCGCRHPDFTGRLESLYQTKLLGLTRRLVGWHQGGRLIHYPMRLKESKMAAR